MRTRVTITRPRFRFERVQDRVDVQEDIYLPHPACPLCRTVAVAATQPDGSVVFQCPQDRTLVLTWSPPVYVPQPVTQEEIDAANAVPLDQAVTNAGLTRMQKTALAAAGAASIGTALWQLLHG